MKHLIPLTLFLLVMLNGACNRFEANHQQIPAVTAEDPKDHTKVAVDTATVHLVDTIHR